MSKFETLLSPGRRDVANRAATCRFHADPVAGVLLAAAVVFSLALPSGSRLQPAQEPSQLLLCCAARDVGAGSGVVRWRPSLAASFDGAVATTSGALAHRLRGGRGMGNNKRQREQGGEDMGARATRDGAGGSNLIRMPTLQRKNRSPGERRMERAFADEDAELAGWEMDGDVDRLREYALKLRPDMDDPRADSDGGEGSDGEGAPGSAGGSEVEGGTWERSEKEEDDSVGEASEGKATSDARRSSRGRRRGGDEDEDEDEDEDGHAGALPAAAPPAAVRRRRTRLSCAECWGAECWGAGPLPNVRPVSFDFNPEVEREKRLAKGRPAKPAPPHRAPPHHPLRQTAKTIKISLRLPLGGASHGCCAQSARRRRRRRRRRASRAARGPGLGGSRAPRVSSGTGAHHARARAARRAPSSMRSCLSAPALRGPARSGASSGHQVRRGGGGRFQGRGVDEKFYTTLRHRRSRPTRTRARAHTHTHNTHTHTHTHTHKGHRQPTRGGARARAGLGTWCSGTTTPWRRGAPPVSTAILFF